MPGGNRRNWSPPSVARGALRTILQVLPSRRAPGGVGRRDVAAEDARRAADVGGAATAAGLRRGAGAARAHRARDPAVVVGRDRTAVLAETRAERRVGFSRAGAGAPEFLELGELQTRGVAVVRRHAQPVL